MTWHRHSWSVVGTEYHPPLENFTARFADRDTFERFTNGWTLIKQRCDCGRTRTFSEIGNWSKAATG
jgi:hypothetical protein